jgi:hypothetical protein
MAVVPTPGSANKNQPVPDWAIEANKTHTPDYAKDSSALILYDEYVETIDASGRATEREREAIRILKPQGRHNTCEVAYDVDEKVNYLRVWTIAADEKQYMAQNSDFAEVGDTSVPIMLSTYKARVAHPPAVDVGATVVCESEEVLEPYMHEKVWRIQNEIAVLAQLQVGACSRGCTKPLAVGTERYARARPARYTFAAGVGSARRAHERAMGRRGSGGNGQGMEGNRRVGHDT